MEFQCVAVCLSNPISNVGVIGEQMEAMSSIWWVYVWCFPAFGLRFSNSGFYGGLLKLWNERWSEWVLGLVWFLWTNNIESGSFLSYTAVCACRWCELPSCEPSTLKERFKRASIGMSTALRAPIVDDVLSTKCYGLSPGACTAQSSSRCNRKAESSLWVTSVLEGLGIFVSGFRG